MNVYDFDKTIYKYDSTIDFYFFCLRHHVSLLRFLPRQVWGAIGFLTKKIHRTEFKELFFSFLEGLSDVDAEVERFWASHSKFIASWYLEQLRESDVIISASPEFLLQPICSVLGIAAPIASRVNKKTGSFLTKNNRGVEKMRRFHKEYGDSSIENFYSDSKSDTPCAMYALNAFLVSGDTIVSWQ